MKCTYGMNLNWAWYKYANYTEQEPTKRKWKQTIVDFRAGCRFANIAKIKKLLQEHKKLFNKIEKQPLKISLELTMTSWLCDFCKFWKHYGFSRLVSRRTAHNCNPPCVLTASGRISRWRRLVFGHRTAVMPSYPPPLRGSQLELDNSPLWIR